MEDQTRVAVVTGGAGGIGSAIVSALIESGHRTVVLDRAGDVECDLASPTSTQRAAQTVLERYGRCDVLVHCAGVFDAMPLDGFDLERWRDLMAVNVEAALHLAKAFAPGMTSRQFGRIIFVSSDGQWIPANADFLPYVTSKAALDGIMRALAVTFGGDGVAVSSVAPGLTDTPLSRSVAGEDAIRDIVGAQVLKRRLTPEDTASAVAFLASDGGEALTGQVLVPNGGAVMR
jgi:NAD(P)-dependent dehydrogenase (short-subunit alcohol dehydrogenase family)